MNDPIREALSELVEMYFSEDRRDADWFEKYSGVWAKARAALAAPMAQPITEDWRTAAITYLRSAAEDRLRAYSGNPSMQTTVDTIMRLAEELELLQQAILYELDCAAPEAQPITWAPVDLPIGAVETSSGSFPLYRKPVPEQPALTDERIGQWLDDLNAADDAVSELRSIIKQARAAPVAQPIQGIWSKP